MKHADGVSKMMQLRGPKSFQNDFDSAMLMALKGLIVSLSSLAQNYLTHENLRHAIVQRIYIDNYKIMEALFSGKACFLDQEEWRYIALQRPEDSFSAQFYEMTDELTRCIATCPWLVKEIYALRLANKSETSTLVRVSALLHRTLEVYGRLQQWYGEFSAFAPLPEEVPSSTEDPLYPVVYRYCNSCTATAFCGYYATIIILHTILVECHHPAGDAGEISLTVDKVCKSVEYLAETGILGPYRIGFAMRVAFEVAPIATRLWIRKWLVRFEKFYKASNPNNFPPIDAADNEL
jgi:hypothetical protein